MGVTTAEILLEPPELTVESAERGAPSVALSGTMFHEGLNLNAWGLTEDGANAIASSIMGEDLTAGHPPIRGFGFTRSIHSGPGQPIGTVSDTDITFIDEAVMADAGGAYTATYSADVLSPLYATDLSNGLMRSDDYGVSIGITAHDDDALCSVCRANFAKCKHYRGEEVEGQVAGPLYFDAEADHLALVYIPAYERASIDSVEGASIATADAFFGGRYDVDETQEDETPVPQPAAAERSDDLADGEYVLDVSAESTPTFTLEL